ncbi:hypothetical protein [Amycolatopsis sp. NPDC051716]|uniref:hypothetical protein n=1 Tax=Amycolatopsis sp. NPDC051716 TaxID=3155804 RepID=UPI00342F0FB0
MTTDSLHDIIADRARALRLVFEDEVAEAIVRLSAGYPHFTHLLALKSAENAIRTGRRRIERSDLPLAMSTAVEDAEGSLRTTYNASVRAQTEVYRKVLTTAASLDDLEFTISQLRHKFPKDFDPTGPLRKLVSNDGSTILRRAAKGAYRFSDPRMRSYIRIIHLMVDPIT